MSDVLPDPPVPEEADLKDFGFTPIFRARLFGSAFHARSTDAEWRAGVTLWLKSWDQVPAGSLPDDDIDLCRLAELGRDLKTWRKVKAGAMRGWKKCSDGRLYHAVVAEVVIHAWSGKIVNPRRGRAGAEAKWGSGSDANKLKRHERLAAAREKGTHTAGEWDALVSFCESKCVRCGVSVIKPVKDHIKPIYQGGSDAIDNLQPMCGPCNSSKGADTSDHRPEGWQAFLQASNCCVAGTKTPAITFCRPEKRVQMPDNREGEGHGEEEKYIPQVGFEEFWSVVPKGRKVDRGHAEKAFRSSLKLATAEQLIDGMRRYAISVDGRELKFIAHPTSWLAGKRWTDELPLDQSPAEGAPTAYVDPEANRERAKLLTFKTKGIWHPHYGPKPGEPGCSIAPQILKEFELGTGT